MHIIAHHCFAHFLQYSNSCEELILQLTFAMVAVVDARSQRKPHHMRKPAAVEQGGLCTLKRLPHSLTASRASLQERTAGGSDVSRGH